MPEYDVFLSHNSADKPAVEIIARRLFEAGLTPWLDIWNLVPGEPWQEAIKEALGACQTVVVKKGANLCRQPFSLIPQESTLPNG